MDWCEKRGELAMRNSIIQDIRRRKIIAIVRGVYGEKITALAQSLADGGIEIMEVTFDQNNVGLQQQTVEAIQSIRSIMGDRMTVGAGTVTSTELVEKTHQAGGQFVVSPNTNVDVIRKTVECGMVSIPGALTPSEVLTAFDAGADFVKIFPAAQLGAEYIKAIREPINNVPLVAVGGMNKENIASFLAAGCVGVGVGGNLVNKEWIANGEFDRISALAREYCKEISEEIDQGAT